MANNIFDTMICAAEQVTDSALCCAAAAASEVREEDRLADQAREKLKAVLSEEHQHTLLELEDHGSARTVYIGGLQYRQGFADGIKFIMQAMAFNPVTFDK